jgi:hypothetical protein
VKHGKELPAADAVGAGAVEFGVREIDQGAAAVGEGAEAVDAFGVDNGLFQESDFLEHGLAAGLQEDACADGAKGGGLLVDRDAVATLGEEEGGGKAGDAAAGDADVEGHGNFRRVCEGEHYRGARRHRNWRWRD